MTTTQPATINAFRGRWAFLSNFHPAPLIYDHIEYPTAEHAFAAGKTLDVRARMFIAAATSPREAKRLGRWVDLRPGWDDRVRFEVMAAVLRAKFCCHPDGSKHSCPPVTPFSWRGIRGVVSCGGGALVPDIGVSAPTT